VQVFLGGPDGAGAITESHRRGGERTSESPKLLAGQGHQGTVRERLASFGEEGRQQGYRRPSLASGSHPCCHCGLLTPANVRGH
jgi:hypothetical protein